MDETSTIGTRLRELRRWRHMTLAEVAGLAGVTASYISMIENGQRPLDRRSMISALAAALRVSETDLTGAPHLGRDPLQSGPHASIPALRSAITENLLGSPSADRARPLPDVAADVEALRPAYAAGDFMRLGSALPSLLDELYVHASDPEEGPRAKAAASLVDALSWSALMCHVLRHPDLAQVASRAAADAATSLTRDPVLTAMATFRRLSSVEHSSAASWVRALAQAERAANALEPYAHDGHSLQVLGMLTLRCALAAAASLNGGAAEHWVGEARKLAARVDDSNPAANWEWFGDTNVSIWSAALAVERGEGGMAVLEAAAAIDTRKLVVPTRRAGLYLDVGRGLARDPRTHADAAKWLRRAEEAAPQQIRNYAPAREAVAYLLTRARTTAGGRELRGMAARMGVPH